MADRSTRAEVAEWQKQASEVSLVGLTTDDLTASLSGAIYCGAALAVAGTWRDALSADAARRYNSPHESWWETNGDQRTREIFENQRRYAGNRNLHEALAQAQSRAQAAEETVQLRRGQVRSRVNLKPNLLELLADNAETATRLGREAETLTYVANTPYRLAALQTRRAIAGLQGSSTDILEVLRNYERLVNAGVSGENPAYLKAKNNIKALGLRAGSDYRYYRDVVAGQELWAREFEVARSIGKYTTADQVRALLGSEAEVRAGKKMVSAALPFGQDLQLYSDALDQKVSADKCHRGLENSMSTNRLAANKFAADKIGLLSHAGSSFCGGAVLSLSSMAAGIVADHALSYLLEISKPDLNANASARMLIDGALVPSLIGSDLPLKVRTPLIAAAFAAGRVATLIPEHSLLKTNSVDSFMIPFAVMSPLSPRYKAAAIASSIVVGRLIGANFEGVKVGD